MAFNPYSDWLGIPHSDKPPNCYQLLAIPMFEADPRTIEAALECCIAKVKSHANWSNAGEADHFLQELRAARDLLLNPDRKAAYDMVLECDFSESDAPPLPQRRQVPAAVRSPALVPVPALVNTDHSREPTSERKVAIPADALPAAPPPAAVRSTPRLSAVPVPEPLRPAGSPTAPAAASERRQRWNVLVSAGLVVAGILIGVLVMLSGNLALVATDPAPLQPAGQNAIVQRPPSFEPPAQASSVPEPSAPMPLPGSVAPDHRKGDAANAEQVPGDVQRKPQGGRGSEGVAATAPAHAVPPPLAPPPAGQPLIPQGTAATADAPPAPALGPAVSSVPQPRPPATVAPAPPPSSGNAAFFAELRLLLDAGSGQQAGGFKLAEERFASARRLCDSDPRLYYAFGLVCLKHLKYELAAENFEQAAAKKEFLLLPAWQAIIWLRLQKKDFDVGLQRLVQLAQLLERSQAAWPDARDRLECASWIGRVSGFVLEPGTEVGRVRTIAAGRDAEIRALLSEPHRAAYAEGKRQVSEQYATLLDWSEQKQEQDKKKREQQQEGTKDQLTEEKERVQDKKEKLDMTADKWKEWIDAQTAECDRQLKALEGDYNRLSTQGQALSTSMQRLNGEIIDLENRVASTAQTSRPTAGAGSAQNMQNLIAQKAALRDLLQSQYDSVDRNAGETQQKAFLILERRAAAVARYQKATGQLVKESGVLGKWDKNLARKEKSAGKKSTSKPSASKLVDPKVRSLPSYVSLDFETERQRLLDTFPPPVK